MLNYQRVNPPFFHFLGLSCKFSLKPIHWMLKHPVIQQWKNAQHNGRGRAPWMTCAILWGSSRSTLPSWAAMGNSHSYDMRNDIAAPKWIERIEKLRDVENWTMWGGGNHQNHPGNTSFIPVTHMWGLRRLQRNDPPESLTSPFSRSSESKQQQALSGRLLGVSVDVPNFFVRVSILLPGRWVKL